MANPRTKITALLLALGLALGCNGARVPRRRTDNRAPAIAAGR